MRNVFADHLYQVLTFTPTLAPDLSESTMLGERDPTTGKLPLIMQGSQGPHHARNPTLVRRGNVKAVSPNLGQPRSCPEQIE